MLLGSPFTGDMLHFVPSARRNSDCLVQQHVTQQLTPFCTQEWKWFRQLPGSLVGELSNFGWPGVHGFTMPLPPY